MMLSLGLKSVKYLSRYLFSIVMGTSTSKVQLNNIVALYILAKIAVN